MRPKILLAGLGETGSELAAKLCRSWDVVAVDPDAATLAAALASGCSGNALRCHTGDATSALTLKRLGDDEFHAAVGCAGLDEANLEFLRLAHDVLGIENRFALLRERSWADHYQEESIEVVSQDRTCAAVLAARIQPGQHPVEGIGLGQGEIVQVEVLPSSSVVGRRLIELHPRRWLVGAVYRQDQLIVPHGDTKLEAGDQVLIIGSPEILPAITTLIRTGESEFPLQYGTNVVTICSRSVERVLDEAAYLIAATRAELFEAIACSADEAKLALLIDECEKRGIPSEFSCVAEGTVESLTEEARRKDVGVLVLPPEPLSLWSRIGLGRSRTARIIDLVSSPVLVCRGTAPYKRVLIALAELPFHSTAAQLGIDVVRMVKGELHLGVAHPPLIVEGTEHREQVSKRRREIEKLAGLYHVKISTEVVEGNPIYEIVRLSRDFDLLVLPYPRGRRSFLTRPDVALNIIHRAHCSVMAMPC